MDLAKLQYFEKVENIVQKDFMNAQNNCILCGGNLELQHVRVQQAQHETPQIKEEAHCPHCDLRTRAKLYTLQ